MLTRTQAVFSVLAATVALSVAAVPADAASRHCGNFDPGKGQWTYGEIQGAGLFDAHGRNAGCRTIRRVARHATSTAGSDPTWQWHAWSCRYKSTGEESASYRCRKGDAVVRWSSGA